jgi:hypothetical protein
MPRLSKRILERLLEHVPNPPRRSGDEHPEREWRDFAPRLLVSDELISDLRTVPVNNHDAPPIDCEIDYRAEAFARVAKLIRDGGPLSRRRERIAADGDYRGPCFGHL